MATITDMKINQYVYKFCLSIILFIPSAFFFLGDHLYMLPTGRKIIFTAIPPIILLGLTILFRQNKPFQKYWELSFAYFCGSFGLFIAWAFGSWPEKYLNVSSNTARGVAILKFFELLPIALVIILLTKFVQGNLAPIYLQKGNLKLGIGLGLGLSILIFGIYLLLSWSKIDLEKAFRAITWIIIFSILDAFFEELLIRGLLLRKFIRLLGINWSLIYSSLVYGLFFLGVQSVAGPIPYAALIFILPLGFVYSFIMYKSDSLWGSLCLHATIDLIFLLGIFAHS